MDIMYMMMGGLAVLAYQKYKEPMSKEINKMTKSLKKKTDKMINDITG